MGPPAFSSSKNPKKSSHEDRSGKKKIKSKSAKRRRDPSISSSSSEFEPDSRSRRKSSKSKKLEKRRKESKSKKYDKTKSRKKRYRRDSSVSSFSSDCSTCSGSDRSRSPVRKSKSRKKERDRGRKRSRHYESSRSRYRSPSCSTCSGGRSRSSSRRRSPIEERFGSSRGHSPIEERFGSSRGHSPTEERFGSGRGHSPTEERFGSGHGRSPIEERYREEGGTKRLRSVLAVMKTSDEDEDKIIKAYDDYPSSRSNEGCDEWSEKTNLDVGNKGNDLYDAQMREEVTLSKRPVKDSDVGRNSSLLCESGSMKDYSIREKNQVAGEEGGKEADDLELILRQKALENFRKFGGGRYANRESLNDKEDECSKPESCQGSQGFMKTSESNPLSSLDDQRYVQGGPPSKELKVSSVVNMATERNYGKAARSLSNDTGGFRPVANCITNRNTFNQFKRVQESSEKTLDKETSSATEEKQSKRIVAQLDSDNKVIGADRDTTDRPASEALNTEHQGCKLNVPVQESASGSQYEQKTFSRVRDGETVQVSYKVYIPKKTPALARRQLQR